MLTDYSRTLIKMTEDVVELPVLQFRKDYYSAPGMTMEQVRNRSIRRKEIIIKKLENKIVHKHTCGIVYYFDKELTTEEEDKLDKSCPCHSLLENPKTKDHHIWICELGHYEISPYSFRLHYSCKECSRIEGIDLPEQVEARTAERLKKRNNEDVKFPAGKELAAKLRKLERDDLAKSIAHEVSKEHNHHAEDLFYVVRLSL